jgi:quinol monooxygenase YgiN
MIFIAAKFRVRPEYADQWAALTSTFAEAVRAEPGCLWFDWSRSLDDPTEYVLIEAFRDDQSGAAHVQSEHFQQARRDLPPLLVETPRVVNMSIPQDDWSELGEMAVDSSPD